MPGPGYKERSAEFYQGLIQKINPGEDFNADFRDEMGIHNTDLSEMLTSAIEYFHSGEIAVRLTADDQSALSVYNNLNKMANVKQQLQELAQNPTAANNKTKWNSILKEVDALGDVLLLHLNDYNQKSNYEHMNEKGMQSAYALAHAFLKMKMNFEEIGAEMEAQEIEESSDDIATTTAENEKKFQEYKSDCLENQVNPSAIVDYLGEVQKRIENNNYLIKSTLKDIEQESAALEAAQNPRLFAAESKLYEYKFMLATIELGALQQKKDSEAQLDEKNKELETLAEELKRRNSFTQEDPDSYLEKLTESSKKMNAEALREKIREQGILVEKEKQNNYQPRETASFANIKRKKEANLNYIEKLKTYGEYLTEKQKKLSSISDTKTQFTVYGLQTTGYKNIFIGKINAAKEKMQGRINELKPRLNDLLKRMDINTKPGHPNSDEFKAMRRAIEEYSNNPTSDNMNEIKRSAEFYLSEKMNGYHSRLFSSSMRYYRLAWANELKAIATQGISFYEKQKNIAPRMKQIVEKQEGFKNRMERMNDDLKAVDRNNFKQELSVKYEEVVRPASNDVSSAFREADNIRAGRSRNIVYRGNDLENAVQEQKNNQDGIQVKPKERS